MKASKRYEEAIARHLECVGDWDEVGVYTAIHSAAVGSRGVRIIIIITGYWYHYFVDALVVSTASS